MKGVKGVNKRKYPSKEKTTTPQGKTEYMKFLMRSRRKRKTELRKQLASDPVALEKLRKIPLAYQLIFHNQIINGKGGDHGF